MKIWKKLRQNIKHQGVQYTPLTIARREIRLLFLHPARGHDEEIRCTLKVVSLDANPHFTALSYVWGAATDTRTIRVDGTRVQVTASLASALRHIRDSPPPSPSGEPATVQIILWVDAVCINQADIQERNQQVPMMKDIYSGAHGVTIWLGEGDALSDHVLDHCRNDRFVDDVEKAAQSGLPPTREQMRVAVILQRNITRRPWWTRVWVVQEMVLAREDPLVKCGLKFCSWSRLVRLHRAVQLWLRNAPPELMKPHDVVPLLNQGIEYKASVGILTSLREEYQVQGPTDTNIVFELATECSATDTRDYVYGCLGFLRPEIVADIEVDYHKSPRDIFHQAVVAAYRHDAATFLTKAFLRLRFRPDDTSFPSWVPDLSLQHNSSNSSKQQQQPSWGDFIDNSYALYENNMMVQTPFGQIDPVFSDSDRILNLRGIKIDKITQVILMESSYEELDDEELDAVIDPMDLPSDVNDIVDPESRRLECQIAGIQQARTLAVARWDMDAGKNSSANNERGPDGILHNLRGKLPLEDLFWLFVPRSSFFVDLTKEEQSLLWLLVSEMTTEQHVTRFYAQAQRWGRWSQLREALIYALQYRMGQKFFISEGGFIGVGVPAIQQGDTIVYLDGMTGPFVLRPVQDGTYKMVGFAYVHEVMDTQVLNDLREDGLLGGLETVFRIS